MTFAKNVFKKQNHHIVVIRGAGDLATGIIVRLKRAHFHLIALECENPSSIRRTVALSEAVYEGEAEVEGIKGVLVHSPSDAISLSGVEGVVPVLVDEKAESVSKIKPSILIDAIIAKRNLGTKITDAPLVIGVGPGFTANVDCNVVIETQRGHYCGRVIQEGRAIENTGIPGIIAGYGSERVIKAPCQGIVKNIANIGDSVSALDVIAMVDNTEVRATISGTLRGLIKNGFKVNEGFKIADIDPRSVSEYIYTCSDKAMAIAGGVMEAIFTNCQYTLLDN